MVSSPVSRRRARFDLQLRKTRLALGRETKIMGVLNITPDSFSDGGLFLSPSAALSRALKMQEEGAHVLDIGGESSRPGSRPISAREEIQRVRPALKRIVKKISIPISIDTWKYDVAMAALDEGVELVNDISALRGDKRLAKLIAKYKAGVVLMHKRGDPRTMQEKPTYRNVLKEVKYFLQASVNCALDAGIARTSVVVDPGFGFGKTIDHNLELLRHLDSFSFLKLPVLVGLSRKSFIGHLVGAPSDGRLYGSLGAAAAAIYNGAHLLRVHDVLAHRHLTRLVDEMTP